MQVGQLIGRQRTRSKPRLLQISVSRFRVA
jgi:hypothetical protein